MVSILLEIRFPVNCRFDVLQLLRIFNCNRLCFLFRVEGERSRGDGCRCQIRKMFNTAGR